MATGLGLSLRTSQHLALTPQLQQSIRLLQLSSLELEQEVASMLESNPCLVEASDTEDEGSLSAMDSHAASERSSTALVDGPESEDPASEPVGEEPDWDGDGTLEADSEEAPIAGFADQPNASTSHADGEESFERCTPAHLPSLLDHLGAQLASLRLTSAERLALEYLIGCLDDSGMLCDTADSLFSAWCDLAGVESSEDTDSAWRIALSLLRHLDPVGLGWCSVVESLQAQARFRARQPLAGEEWRHVSALLDAPLEWIARRDLKRLAQRAGIEADDVVRGLDALKQLNPRPAADFELDNSARVVPDVIVLKQGRSFRVEINPDVVPRVAVDAVFSSAGRLAAGTPLATRLQEARWFVKNIAQRFDTIRRVSEAIVERQRRFFTHGVTAMKPLVLREIADELGVHESTVSRVTTGKFMATSQGTFELKFFFGSSLADANGGSTSSTAVRAIIQQMISQEDPQDPLSDAALATALASRGITCARRTVAKYREALHIPVSGMRKS